MSDFISREAAIKLFNFAVLDCLGMEPTIRAGDIIKALESIPAADVRPVVMCRDCKHNMANIPDIRDGININENWNACQLTELYDGVKPEDFCSRGKREES